MSEIVEKYSDDEECLLRQHHVIELSFNVDDMTAEELGFAMERLREEGALEAYSIPIVMKKSRPGSLVRVMVRRKDKSRMIPLIFQNTTTNGVRETPITSYALTREVKTVNSSMGEVRVKDSTGFGVKRRKYEYDDVSRIAAAMGISIREVRKRLMEEAMLNEHIGNNWNLGEDGDL